MKTLYLEPMKKNNIKKIWKFKIVLILFASNILLYSCNEDQPNDCQQIDELMMKQQHSWNNGNIEEFMSFYWNNDSLMFIGKNGIQYGWQTTLDNYQKSYPNKQEMGELNFTNLHCIAIGDQYYQITGNWKLIRIDSLGNLTGFYSLLWKKMDDRWVIVYDHTN